MELGKKLRKRVAGQPAIAEPEVRAKLEKELEDMLQGRTLLDAINPLLGMNGDSDCIFHVPLSNSFSISFT